MPDQGHNISTRERLLQAALEVFAEHGYRAATIREICRRADANVAAVHYHFGDKSKLYEAIYGHLFETLHERRTAFLPPDANPEVRLRVHIRTLFEEIFCCEGNSERQVQLSRLYLNEMVRPTEALDRIVTEHFEPDARMLYEIVAALLETTPTDPLTIDCAASVIGQILYYHHAMPILSRLHPDRPAVAERLDAIIEQVWLFSLGGIERAKQSREMLGQPPLDDAADQGC
ncbi:MAG: CerR family C-terminal domain-containing protein [Chromatiaceae bacterium]|uniref:TetR/AcrR family transcriptional regulator n=1 Tax=Lamprobacter modestohalophilus TaxID=1064514 RepID=UPI001904C674|nr:CerR family C-terminal domain-containing protein [Lamprobacter modestohalophilus]MCF8005705.1 CerR family C-terminal domain-containing protein [Chromatiaceae bacterium]MCF8016386.1 CerR family C-terminal domain-containing protein [Chromatiaceae bacterium]